MEEATFTFEPGDSSELGGPFGFGDSIELVDPFGFGGSFEGNSTLFSIETSGDHSGNAIGSGERNHEAGPEESDES